MKAIKLSPEVIGLISLDFHYNLSRESLVGEWTLDEDFYYEEKRAFKLHNSKGEWLELYDEHFMQSIKYTIAQKY